LRRGACQRFFGRNGRGSLAPKGTPKDIIAKLKAAAVETVAADLGFDTVPRDRQTPEGLGALVKADAKRLWPLVKEFGIKAEWVAPTLVMSPFRYPAMSESGRLARWPIRSLAGDRYRIGGVPPNEQTAEGVGALVKADIEKWWPLIKEFGIKAEWVEKNWRLGP
jgi:hypothetical protein